MTFPAGDSTGLADLPYFELRGFQVPTSVEVGLAFAVTLAVANVGEHDGWFHAELGATTILDMLDLQFDVPTRETAEHTTTVDLYVREAMTDSRSS